MATRTRGARLALLGAAVAVVLALAGCSSNDGVAAQFASGDGKGYISGTGVTELKSSQRGKPITFSGTTEDGSSFSSADEKGKVLVVNFWYAACGPCRVEAKSLQKINEQFAGKDVVFVGVNTRDSADTVKTYDTTFGVTYPSILDVNGGAVQLAFSGSMRPNATPTTLVLDPQGRVAARMEGPVSDQPSTLVTLIDDALASGH
jgi:thiol-disulfide isomerase/thioredoxin